MKKRNLLGITILLVAMVLSACSDGVVVDSQYYYDYAYSKSATDEQFDFEGNYIPPELTIDGIADDLDWNNGSTTLTYGKDNHVNVKFYRGDLALFVFFEVIDENILTLSEDGGDDVNKGDSVEIYLNIANDDASQPVEDDIQINIGVNGKTRILVASDGSWGTWTGLIDFAIATTGTLNDDTDVDTGYAIELMIPYSQINMNKDDAIGVSFGHVDKVDTGNAANTDYFWTGIVFEGAFIDPQSPVSYIIFDEQSFYSRNNMPLSNISISGQIVDQNNQPVENAKVSIGDKETTSNVFGEYTLENINRDDSFTIVASKDDFTLFEKTYTKQEARGLNEETVLNITLINLSIDVETTFVGIVENVYEGLIADATVTITTNDEIYQASTDEQGVFSIEAIVSETMTVEVSKSGYQNKIYSIDSSSIVADNTTDLEQLDLMLLSSEVFTFGGNRGINAFDATVTRGLEGFYFEFNTQSAFPESAHIELFVDTKTSIADRDNTDYRIDFSSTGSINIINFGNGENTDLATSGITSNVTKTEESATVKAYIPYAFFGIDSLDVIGISAGVWSGSDWDGWAYLGAFVAPEFATSYVRIGEDNQLYTYQNNEKTTLFYGVVSSEEQLLENVDVNGVFTNAQGYYELRVPRTDISITATKGSYIDKTIEINAVDMMQTYILDIELIGDFYTTVSGHVGVEGVTIYLLSDDSNSVISDENGDYTINDILNTVEQTLVFEKDGYNTYELILSSEELQASNPVTADVLLVEEEVLGSYQGQILSFDGEVEGVTVQLGDQIITSDENGMFAFVDVVLMNYTITLTKVGYDTVEAQVLQSALLENETNEYELLKVGQSSGTFSGKNAAFTAGEFMIQRGIDGLYFTFTGETQWRTSIDQNEIIELFIDTKASDSSRNDTDYLIGIKANGTISSINNWGGTNTDSMSLEVVKIDENHILLYIPYSFLNIDSDEIFGVSVGVWNEFASDWDGWAYQDSFIAPEVPSNYVRVDVDNSLYRFDSNDLTTVFSGYVTSDGTAIESAEVDSVLTDVNGYYTLRVSREDVSLTATKLGFISEVKTFLEVELEQYMTQDFILDPITSVSVTGLVSVEGVTVYVLGDQENSVLSDENGAYDLGIIDSTNDTIFVFEKEGYNTKQIEVSSTELSSQTTYILNVTLIEAEAEGVVTGTVVSLNGVVSGATVTLNDVQTITDENGIFSFTQVNVENQSVLVTYDGFEDEVVTYTQEQVGIGTSQVIELIQPGGFSGNFSGKSAEFTTGSLLVQRGYEGIYFTFTGETAWRTSETQHEVIELFLDTKTSTSTRDTTDYVVRLRANGTIESVGNWGGSNWDSSTFVVTVIDAQTIELFIPYAFLDIEPTETLGMSLGVWNEFVSDWDGWGYNGSFIAPEVPTNYVRIGADNQLYISANNE